MRTIGSVSQVCLLMAFNLFTINAAAVARPQPGIMVPPTNGNPSPDAGKPTLVAPNPICETKFVNGKRIINNTQNPAECARKVQEKAQQKKQAAINAAVQAIKVVEAMPQKPEECIRTVNPAAQECLRAKLQKDSQTKPKYVVGSKSNKVVIYDGKDKVFIGTRVQSHYTKKPAKPKPSKIVNEYNDVVVFNELGDVIATKTPKTKQKMNCICPTPGAPVQTTERIISDCIKQDCTGSGMITNILNNATVEVSPETETKPKEEKEAAKAG